MSTPNASSPPDAAERLPYRDKFAFLAGDFGNNIFWQFFMYFLLFFYTDVYKIAPGKSAAIVAGEMFLWVRIWDAVFDVIIGLLADRTNSRWGKYRPYLLYGALPFAVAGILEFTTPNFGPTAKIAYAYATYSLMLMIYSLVSIPQNSLLGVITPDLRQRAILSKYKFIGAFGGGLVMQACTAPLADYFGDHGRNAAHGYQMALICYAAVAFVCFILCFAGVRERVSPPPSQDTNLGRDLRELLSNGPWIVVGLGTLAMIMCLSVRYQTILYYFKYYVGDRTLDLPFVGTRRYSYDALSSGYLVLGNIATIAGCLLVPYFIKLMGKKALYIAMIFASSLLSLVWYVLRADQVYAIFGLQTVVSLIQGPFCVVLWAMYADCADFAEWKHGRRATALVFSAGIMAQKCGWAIGAWFTGALLSDYFGYIPDAVQTPTALRGIIDMNSTLSCLFGLVSVGILFFYGLPERKMKTIETELKARRLEIAAAEPDALREGASA